MKAQWRGKAGLILGGAWFGLFIAIAVGEIAIRISLSRAFQEKVRQFNESDGYEYALDPSSPIGYRLKPGHVIQPGKGLKYTINAQGFRGAVVPEVRSGDGARILFIGDSFTFGYGVGDESTFPAIAQRLLRASGMDAECVNLGVIGYNLAHYRESLLENIERFHPDVVVVNVYVNDAEPTHPGVVPVNPRESFKDVWFWSYHELASQWGWSHRKRIEEDALISFGANHPKRRDARRAFADIVQACSSSKVELLVTSTPLVLESDFATDYKYERVGQLFKEWAHEFGAPLLDLRDEILESGGDPGSLVIPNDGHYSARGNHFVASRIVDRIRPLLKAK